MKDKNILFQSTIKDMHTSTAIMDRVCRTIRDIAFNLNIRGNMKIPGLYTKNTLTEEQKVHGNYTQEAMDLILYYYNNTAHDTLTQMIFKTRPDLKQVYPEGITPASMENNAELENIYVKACIDHNFKVKSQSNFILNPLLLEGNDILHRIFCSNFSA